MVYSGYLGLLYCFSTWASHHHGIHYESFIISEGAWGCESNWKWTLQDNNGPKYSNKSTKEWQGKKTKKLTGTLFNSVEKVSTVNSNNCTDSNNWYCFCGRKKNFKHMTWAFLTTTSLWHSPLLHTQFFFQLWDVSCMHTMAS